MKCRYRLFQSQLKSQKKLNCVWMRNKNTQEKPDRHFISFWSEAGRIHFFLRIEDTLIIPKRHFLDHTNKTKPVVRYKNKCFSILDSTIEIILTLGFKGCLISYAHTVNLSMSFIMSYPEINCSITAKARELHHLIL